MGLIAAFAACSETSTGDGATGVTTAQSPGVLRVAQADPADPADPVEPVEPDMAAAPGPHVAAEVLVATPQDVYATHCAVCHGESGTGDGPAAYLVFPKPRDFTSGRYRFKSTPEEQPPTLEDLRRTIRLGIARTAMPPFGGVLSDEQITELAGYVRSLDVRNAADGPSSPIAIPPAPDTTAKLIDEGKLVYQAMGCAACHGETGQGDGPSSYSLVDSDGVALPPADFTTGVYKAGREEVDLYRTITVGVPGTPMPGFEAVLEENLNLPGVSEQTNIIWAMVAYLKSLERPREPVGIRTASPLHAHRVNDVLALSEPDSPVWATIKSQRVSLQPLWQRKYSSRSLAIRVAHDEAHVALLLEWGDDTFDAVTSSVEQFSDMAAVMFSLTADPPALTMGKQPIGGSGEPTVNLWQWRADRQMRADRGQVLDVPLESAGVPVDYYVGKKGDPVVGPITQHDPVFVPAWREGNPKADPALLGRSILESNAAGFGSLTLQPPASQDVTGRGIWTHGAWRVVLIRSLKPNEEMDVDLTTRTIPIALAVWNGSAGDRNGTKLISGWHWLMIQPENAPAMKEPLQ